MTNELRRTPKLRLLSAFLAAAMTLTTLPAAAFAADVTDYELAVNGKRVTSANATNILDDGKASYDAVTRTLTLSGDISATDNAVNPFGEQITVDGNSTLTLTDGQKELYAGLCGTKTINVAAGADITLDAFGYGISYAGADISGNVTIRNVDFGVTSGGATIRKRLASWSLRTLTMQFPAAVQKFMVRWRSTAQPQPSTMAESRSMSGGVVTITGATSGLNGGSTVDGGSLSVSATTCIDNGAVTFTRGTLKLDSTSDKCNQAGLKAS